MNYWAIKNAKLSDGVYLSEVSPDMPKAYQFDDGISLIDEYPSVENCKINYDPNRAEGTCLYDFIDNINRFMISNHKVTKVFDELGIANIEYLPIWLVDHQFNISSKDYSICNVLGGVDIFDMEKSDYVPDPFDESLIARVKNMVVDYNAIPKDAKVFRASKKTNQIFICDDVKQALEDAGITGYTDKLADGWNGR